jgi:transcriptional regulator with XRE-family HTH domain
MENLMDKLAKRIGKKISDIRRKRSITSEKLAYENGISKGYMSDIENGKKIPSIKTLDQIATALGVDIRELF